MTIDKKLDLKNLDNCLSPEHLCSIIKKESLFDSPDLLDRSVPVSITIYTALTEGSDLDIILEENE